MGRFRGMRFLISPQVDAQTSDTLLRLLLDEGAVATDELVGLDGCDLYVTHLSAGQLAAGAMPTPAHSRGLRMLLSSDLNLNHPPAPSAPPAESRARGSAACDEVGGSGAHDTLLARRVRPTAESSVRSGLISSARLGGASDTMLRRALRVPSVECVAARSLLAQLGAISGACLNVCGLGGLPPGSAPTARGCAPSDSMLPRSIQVRSAAERKAAEGRTALDMRAPSRAAHADQQTRLVIQPHVHALAPPHAAACAHKADGAVVVFEAPSDITGLAPGLAARPPDAQAAEPLSRTASIMRAESLCATEASHGTGVTALSATATQLHTALTSVRVPPRGADTPADALAGGRLPPPMPLPCEVQAHSAVPRLPRKPSSVPPAVLASFPVSARVAAGTPVHVGGELKHTLVVVPPRAGVTGAPTTIRWPLEPNVQPRHLTPAQASAVAAHGDCAQLVVSDISGRYKPLRGTIDVHRLRRMWPRRVAAVLRAASAGQPAGGAPRAGCKRPLAKDHAESGAQHRAMAPKVVAGIAGQPAKLSRCDVCDARFADLDEHLDSQRHREVVNHPTYFEEFDAFIERHGLGVGVVKTAVAGYVHGLGPDRDGRE